jgi:Holliday junction resolvase RusA-like endonuclease
MPPSANVYWRWSKRRGVHRSKKAKAYIAKVRRLYAPRPLTERVSVRIDVHLCRGDVDNRVKVTLDALKGLAFVDDKQVRSFEVHGYESSSKTDRVVVRIEPHVPVRSMEDDPDFKPDPPGWKWPAAFIAEQKRARASKGFHTPMPAPTLENGFAYAAKPNVVKPR